MTTKPSNLWHCPTCDVTIEHAAIKDHLTTVHGLKSLKGKRSLALHLDAADHFVTSYEWTFKGGLMLGQTIVALRRPPPFWRRK